MSVRATSSLSQCYTCQKTFSSPLDEKEFILTVCCYKIVHKACLAEWLTQSQKPCPNCQAPIQRRQAGKWVEAVWDAFRIASDKYPNQVTEIFNREEPRSSISQDVDECSTCLEDLPDPHLVYLTSVERFAHTDCVATTTSLEKKAVSVLDLAHLTKQLCLLYPELKKKFTPEPSNKFTLGALWPFKL